ncbi:MAG: PqqD family protein [Myxococcaceae bacterium]|nr:PqqD family protein [Myxococcaceae bacterium]
MKVEAASVCARQPAAAFHRFGDDTVVLDATGTQLRGLNATGARVWEMLDGQKTLRQIAETLAAEFHAPVGQVENEITAFAAQLAQKQLITIKAP